MKLHEGVDAYVEGRRTYGAVYPNGIQTLSAFCRYAGNVPLDTIRQRQVAAFLDGPATSEATWQNKYKQLRISSSFGWRGMQSLRYQCHYGGHPSILHSGR